MCSNKRTNTLFPLILFILVGENHSGKINTQDREGERGGERERERERERDGNKLVSKIWSICVIVMFILQ